MGTRRTKVFAQQADEQGEGRSNVKILLVEDSRTLRVSNERALLKAGYEVTCAEDGEAALQCAKEQMPDLILLDLLLPQVCPDFCVSDQVLFLGMGCRGRGQFLFPCPSL